MPQPLTRLERTVITLALGDPASSLNRQSNLTRWLFGPRQGRSPLADPKLEALRSYVVLRRRYGMTRAAPQSRSLREAGYCLSDLSHIDRLIDDRSAGSRAKRAFLQGKGKQSSMGNISRMCGRVVVSATILLTPCWDGVLTAQTLPQSDAAMMVPDEGPGGPGGPGDGPGGDHIAIGVGGMFQPNYLGAKKYQFQPLPAIDIKQGKFFVNFQNGIGFAPIETETFTVGGGIVMATDNYSRKDVPGRFNKISMGAGARGFVAVRQFGFEATAGLTQIFAGGTKGMIADFNLSRPIMVNERLFLNPSIGTRWANAKHNNRFYGVNERQSELSGLRQFRPGSGFLDARAEIGLQYRLTEHIGFGTIAGVATVMSDVKDSPIVRKKTAPYGMGFISYSF
jgi:MipA family protein